MKILVLLYLSTGEIKYLNKRIIEMQKNIKYIHKDELKFLSFADHDLQHLVESAFEDTRKYMLIEKFPYIFSEVGNVPVLLLKMKNSFVEAHGKFVKI